MFSLLLLAADSHFGMLKRRTLMNSGNLMSYFLFPNVSGSYLQIKGNISMEIHQKSVPFSQYFYTNNSISIDTDSASEEYIGVWSISPSVCNGVALFARFGARMDVYNLYSPIASKFCIFSDIAQSNAYIRLSGNAYCEIYDSKMSQRAFACGNSTSFFISSSPFLLSLQSMEKSPISISFFSPFSNSHQCSLDLIGPIGNSGTTFADIFDNCSFECQDYSQMRLLGVSISSAVFIVSSIAIVLAVHSYIKFFCHFDGASSDFETRG